MSQQYSSQILVYGNTLAASMTVLALSKQLAQSSSIIWVKPSGSCTSEVLYGGSTSPDAYQFNLQLGVSEPELILQTDTSFSFGTQFTNWGSQKLAWMQCFHLPFAATNGVALHHLMTRHKAQLGDFLISGQAAQKGTFAHPPTENLQSPLSRAEYGYHFDPCQWSSIFLSKLDKTCVKIIAGEFAWLKRSQSQGQNHIESIQLEDGTKLQANLFIDCSGTSSKLFSNLDSQFISQRKIHLSRELQACQRTGPARRLITGNDNGWQSVTSLRKQNCVMSLTECPTASTQGNFELSAQTITLGQREKAWQGNCLAIGHAAYALEPVTPAPYILLKKDIQRLLELIPVNQNVQFERQEYNRRFQDDITHAELFHRAIYFQQRDLGLEPSEKLERKLSQYEHRGIITSYDFEPFNEQDWAILHAGLGRIPKHYDRMAEQIDFKKMQANLDTMRAGIAHLASSMPEHHIYLEKLSIHLSETQIREAQQYDQ